MDLQYTGSRLLNSSRIPCRLQTVMVERYLRAILSAEEEAQRIEEEGKRKAAEILAAAERKRDELLARAEKRAEERLEMLRDEETRRTEAEIAALEGKRRGLLRALEENYRREKEGILAELLREVPLIGGG